MKSDRPSPCMPIAAEALDLLRCPITSARLRLESAATSECLVAESAAGQPGISYPIVNGIPVLLAEAARVNANPNPE